MRRVRLKRKKGIKFRRGNVDTRFDNFTFNFVEKRMRLLCKESKRRGLNKIIMSLVAILIARQTCYSPVITFEILSKLLIIVRNEERAETMRRITEDGNEITWGDRRWW